MKKLLTLLLALCLSLSICLISAPAYAAGEDLSDEERYEIFIEVAKEYGYYDFLAPIIQIYPNGMGDLYSSIPGASFFPGGYPVGPGASAPAAPATPATPAATAAPVEEDPNTAERSIVFDEPVMLYEDERIGVALGSVYQKESSGEIHKYISLKVHNKTDRYWLFHLDGLYLDGEATSQAMVDGNSGPDAGIKKEFRFRIAYDNGIEERPLDSLEQLLKAELKISVDLFDEKQEYLVDDFLIRFSYDVTDLVP